jgi:hypothetical protein
VAKDIKKIKFDEQAIAPAYGTSVHAFEITSLSAFDYQETLLEPSPLLTGSGTGWNADGMHHLDIVAQPDCSAVCAVDGWHWNKK